MKKLLIQLPLFLLFAITSNAQTFDWVNTAKIYRSNNIVDTKIDRIGNSYSAGIIQDSIIFDSVPAGITGTLYGTYDSYLSKSDTSGKIEWIGQLNGLIYSFDTDDAGNMYLFFFYLDTIDADPGAGVFLLPKNSSPGYPLSNGVAKIDPQGNLVWAKSITALGITDCMISVDKNGEIYFILRHSGKVDLDPSIFTAFTPSLLSIVSIFKWSTDGHFIWGGGLGGISTTDITFRSFEVKNNRLIITGKFTGIVDFNIDTNIAVNRSTINFSNIFILAYDTSGTFQWVKDFTRPNNSDIIGSYLDDNSNIYLSGGFRDAMDFNFGPGRAILTPINGENIYILSMDSAGNFNWVKQITSSLQFSRIFGINTHGGNTGYIYITFSLNGSLDLTPTNPGVNIVSSSGGFSSNFVTVRFKLDGNYSDSWIIGTAGQSSVDNLTVGKRNSLTYTGKFIDSVDFDPSHLNQIRYGSARSFYILRLNQCFETTSQSSEFSCGNFSSHSGKYVWSASGLYTDTIPNHMGCDSVIDINLSLVNTDTTLLLLGNTLASNEFSATFKWLDCNANYAAIPNQTVQFFTPAQNGSYALEITKNGCVDTTACFGYTLVGQQEFSLENSINVFPNPSNGVFNVLVNTPYDRLTVTDISGRVIITQDKAANSTTSIDLSSYDNGIYFIEIMSKEKRVVKKLMKH